MNPLLKKLIDHNFMKEAQVDYIEAAILRKDSFIIAGHDCFGLSPLIGAVSSAVEAHFAVKQIKCFEDLNTLADYYILDDLPAADYASLLAAAMQIPGSALIARKDPNHPYSMIKLLAATGGSKVYQYLECAKPEGEKKLVKMQQICCDQSGKVTKTNWKD